MMETWRKVFRDGLVPVLRREHLEVLRTALKNGDVRLLQGATTSPPPLKCCEDWQVDGACLIGFCGWQAEPFDTVKDVIKFFADTCLKVNEQMGEPAACRYLLNWFDEAPRDEVFRELLVEVERVLAS